MNENTHADVLLQLIDDLPIEGSYEYELKLTKSANDRAFLGAMQHPEKEIYEIITDEELTIEKRYAAFYLLNIIYRHKKKYVQLNELIEKHRKLFSKRDSYHHLEALCAFETDFQNRQLEVIQTIYKRAQSNPDNPGCQNMFAHVVATALEQSGGGDKSEIISMWRGEAVEAIKSAIRQNSSYAKYYYTLARLQLINEEYDEATKNVNNAILREDVERDDYMIRVGDYQYFKMQIMMERQKNQMQFDMKAQEARQHEQQMKLETEITGSIEKIKSSILNNVEIIGFFSGIVSFTIGSIQISSGFSFPDAAKLIVVLFAGLMSVYSGFGYILGGALREKTRRYLACFIMGVIMIIGVLFFG